MISYGWGAEWRCWSSDRIRIFRLPDGGQADQTIARRCATGSLPEIRLVTVANPAPAGKRFVDFVVLTTEPGDTYEGFKPYKVASPFTLEALARSRVFVRFKNNHK